MNDEIYVMIGWNCNDEVDSGAYLFQQPPYDWADDGIRFSVTETMFTAEAENVTHWMKIPELSESK